jgi:hypothetical protein
MEAENLIIPTRSVEEFQRMESLVAALSYHNQSTFIEAFKIHIECDNCNRCKSAWLDALAIIAYKACEKGYDASARALN